MADKQVIVVMGATGAQGGGLARAILRDTAGPFAVRAVTRNPGSDKARALADLGAEVVAADADDPKSLDPAFAGAYGAYCVTNFWEHFSGDRETAQARALAEASKRAGVQHVVWSTLEDTRKTVPLSDDRMPTLKGKYKVPHFDAKGESDHFFTDLGLRTTFSLPAFYWENLVSFGAGPKPGPDGTLAITFPLGDKKMAGIGAEDIGKCVLGMFKAGDTYIGKRVGLAGEHLTCHEMAAKLTRALGREVRYNAVTPEQYRSFGFPGADDLGNMFQFYRDFDSQVNGLRDVRESRKLNPELQSFDQWLVEHARLIPLE